MKNTALINTILFDLDETLSDHKYSLERAFRGIQNEYTAMQGESLDLLMKLYTEALDEAFVYFLDGKISHQEARRKRVKIFFAKLNSPIEDADIDPFLSRYNEIYMSDRRATPGAVSMLETLRARGYKIGVVTNGGEDIQQAKLKEIGIESLIDVLITSAAVGYAKPAPEIFEAALKRLEAKKEETFMIGDKLENDVKGALGAGITAILYNPDSKENTIQIDSVSVPIISHMEQLSEYLGIK